MKNYLTVLACAVMLTCGCGRRNGSPLEPPANRKQLKPEVTLSIHTVSPTATEATTEYTVPVTNEKVHLLLPSIITADDVRFAWVSPTKNGMPGLAVRLTKDGGDRMAKATRKRSGRLGIVINDKLINAPKIHSPISGEFVIPDDGHDFGRLLQ